MNSAQVQRIVSAELSKGEQFMNFHGITQENLDYFLVDPFAVLVDPDDDDVSEPREMWIVLQERPNPQEGYVVVYDPYDFDWGVAEYQNGGRFILIAGADSLAEALDSM